MFNPSPSPSPSPVVVAAVALVVAGVLAGQATIGDMAAVLVGAAALRAGEDRR